MSWSIDPPARFTLHYEWPRKPLRPRAGAARPTPLALIADSLEDAKLEAAILYACDERTPPAYRIVRGAKRVVYRFPEAIAEAA
ncbi:hypothetical protein [Phenylobacterium sp.]|jgi:hypothetical protein|uniref:hypothetical protein n=1 Tax=Phenylobacterium sp. TaxID=1871053 RepID=UPI002F3ECC5A